MPRFSIHSVLLLLLSLMSAKATSLDDYVATPDPHYNYSVIGSEIRNGYTVHYINMTSQKWQSEEWVSRSVWWHALTVVVPHKLKYQTVSHVFIDGGKNKDGFVSLQDQYVNNIFTAVSGGFISCHVGMVPNQPITFSDDPEQKGRNEDELLAYTFMKYINSKGEDPNVIVLLPMTKAVVRAMDTVTDFAQKQYGYKVENFLVSGASKRGWTAWLTAAVDPRVIGIGPIVFDLLNFIPNFKHWYSNLGGWSFAIYDYVVSQFTMALDSNYTKQIFDSIDPMVYNDRYERIPKLISRMSGDEIMMLDDTYYFYDNLKGPKYISTEDNVGHTGSGHEFHVMQNILTFFQSIITVTPIPEMTWKNTATDTWGRIKLNVNRRPQLVQVYYAETQKPKRMGPDFRINVYDKNSSSVVPQPVIWKSVIPQKGWSETPKMYWSKKGRQYYVSFNIPDHGGLAFYIKAFFKSYSNSILELTTETVIIPKSRPFPECQGVSCAGPIV